MVFRLMMGRSKAESMARVSTALSFTLADTSLIQAGYIVTDPFGYRESEGSESPIGVLH